MRTVIPYVIERHVDEASFLWERRQRASISPIYDFGDVVEIDERLEANLDGIILADKVGLEKAEVALDIANTAAELFVVAFVAAMSGDAMAFAKFLVKAQQMESGDDAIVSALEWLPVQRAEAVLNELMEDSSAAFLRSIGIRAYVVRREDLGSRLEQACMSSDASVRHAALRAIGELGRRDLLPMLREEIRFQGEDAVPWAVWSAALLGESNAHRLLWSIAEQGERDKAAAACDLASRCGKADEVAARLEKLAQSPATLEVALVGAAARGDCAAIPWVLEVIAHLPEHARRAAWVYATITGASLESALANRVPTTVPSDQMLTTMLLNPYEDLPTPDVAALRAHWEQIRSGFSVGERRLAGRIIEPGWLVECLHHGKQPWRASAAIEIARGSGRLFPVTSLSRIQKSWFQSATITHRVSQRLH